jgi:Fibronectin type III domain
MTAKMVVLRRAVGAGVALVLALGFVGSVAAARGDRTPPTTPTNLHATSVGQTSVTLAWNPSTDKSSFSYSINVNGLSVTVPQTQTSYTIDWLSAGRTYTFYVTAVDSNLNTSGKSNILTVTTLADNAAPPAATLSGLVRGPSQVRLAWNRVEDDTSSFVRYQIFANGVRVTEHLNWIGETSLVLRHLTPTTTDTFTVKTLDQDENASTSNAVTLTTEASSDVTPPSVPANVRIVGGFGCPEFFFGWTQSTDDIDPQFLIEYEIYVNGVLSPLAVSAGVDQDFVYATDSGANTFTVKAVDQAGNTSAASNGVTEFC